LRRLAARVDALSVKSDRSMYVRVHLELHQRIAECAPCDALRDAIEKTHAMALIWFCVMRKPSPDASTHRHQVLLDEILTGDAHRIAEAVREHLAVGRRHTLELLKPYFRLHKNDGPRFSRAASQLEKG
jgi:DNA-binding GntR family transcriptional regulator